LLQTDFPNFFAKFFGYIFHSFSALAYILSFVVKYVYRELYVYILICRRKNFSPPKRGRGGRGCGGNSAAPERWSPAACSVRNSRSQQKSFLFLLEEKIGARKRKAEKIFLLAGERQRAAVGRLHWSGFSSKKVRISSKQYRQFTISAFWREIASRLRRSAGALRAPKPHFATDCHAPRGEKETAWFWIWKFVLAKPKTKQSFADQSFFVSPLAKHGNDNFNILTALI
jgi:hypothetical protein